MKITIHQDRLNVPQNLFCLHLSMICDQKKHNGDRWHYDDVTPKVWNHERAFVWLMPWLVGALGIHQDHQVPVKPSCHRCTKGPSFWHSLQRRRGPWRMDVKLWQRFKNHEGNPRNPCAEHTHRYIYIIRINMYIMFISFYFNPMPNVQTLAIHVSGLSEAISPDLVVRRGRSILCQVSLLPSTWGTLWQRNGCLHFSRLHLVLRQQYSDRFWSFSDAACSGSQL